MEENQGPPRMGSSSACEGLSHEQATPGWEVFSQPPRQLSLGSPIWPRPGKPADGRSARASASKGKGPIDPEVDDRYGEPESAAR